MTLLGRLPRLLAVLVTAGALVRCAPPAHAAGSGENRAFTNAVKSFEGGWWPIADQELDAFLQKYPKTDRRAEALLLQAQARCQMGQAAGAIALLTTNLPQAGSLADRYQFWLGEAYFQASNYVAAAEAYARLLQEFPDSNRRLDALVGQARSSARLDQWSRVTEILGAPASLAVMLRTNPASRVIADGLLLLAEASLEQRRFTETQAALTPLDGATLPPRGAWLRQYLLCRAAAGEGRLVPALTGATNLLALATRAAQSELVCESRDFLAGLLAESERRDAAIALLEENLGTNTPPAFQQAALFRLVQLLDADGRLDEASQRLAAFLQRNPGSASAPSVLLALGELHLRRHLAAGGTNAPDTNALAAALADFNAALTNQLPSTLLGRAQLLRGWALWLREDLPGSRAAFEAAAAALPLSEDQAVARFKLADTAFQQRDFTTALTNYTAVVAECADFPAAASRLLEPALYQQLRTALALGNQAVADAALSRLLAEFPGDAGTQSGMLLLGQARATRGDAAAARAVIEEFLKRFPDSSLLPQAALALARTWEQAGRWDAAIAEYDAWMTNFPAHPLRALADYGRAWALYEAGQETNAFASFTNFVAAFPTNPLAPLAQNWIGDFHFRHGDYKSAEEDYQWLFQKWPASELAAPARMMAGRAAVARLGFADALSYFTRIINDTNAPALVAEALFAYGDVSTRMEVTDTNKPLANYVDALGAFNKLLQLFPTNALAPLAQGRVGDCYLQLATLDPKNYDSAAQAYQKVLEDPRAGVAARSQAEVGLGWVLEKQSRLKAGGAAIEARRLALERFLRVAYEKNLRDGEAADAYWVRRAALEGARLAEEAQMPEQAAQLYEYLGRQIPALKPSLEGKLLKLRSQIGRPES